MQNNFFFLSKSCYENNSQRYIKTRSTPSLRPLTTINLAFHAGYYKFSHKHIKPTHTGNLLIDAHNMTHLSGFPISYKFRQNAIMLPQTNASHGNDFRRLVSIKVAPVNHVSQPAVHYGKPFCSGTFRQFSLVHVH